MTATATIPIVESVMTVDAFEPDFFCGSGLRGGCAIGCFCAIGLLCEVSGQGIDTVFPVQLRDHVVRFPAAPDGSGAAGVVGGET
ncbi:hypothetical protein Pve01_70460 [Planomonospora venezuelensis]|nr:hypothetical protein Pve01_70460 [Planomonospora venezuelensis]